MKRIEVWAPAAKEVAVQAGGALTPLSRIENGRWEAEFALADGDDYAFLIDGEGPFPDPRSPFQPQGVHGPSRHVDHSRFPWTDAGFRASPLSAGLIYELHVGTFTPEGTFAGAADRLHHLAELGVTHVELMPVAEFAGRRGWGYDGVDLYAPHHAYGGPDGLKRFVNACHDRGIAVILDVVYNHLGPEGNYLPRFGPYFTASYRTPWGEAVNLDGPGSDHVRRHFLDNARMWIRDYHLDGLRVDAVHAFLDSSAMFFVEELAAAVHALEGETGRPLFVIAESDLNDPRVVRPPETGGYGCDAQWNEDFHHALHAVLTGERTGYYRDFGRLADLATALCAPFVLDGRHSAHRDRRHGRSGAGLPARRFIGFLQNHDQIGNRAQGDRIGHLAGLHRARLGALLVFTAPYPPMLFQGEEWAASTPFQYFTDHDDRELRAAVAAGRKREFADAGWNPDDVPDPGDPETHRRSVLDFTETEREPHASMLAFHRELSALRRRRPELAAGEYPAARPVVDEAAGTLVVVRGDTVIAANFSDEPRAIRLPERTGRELILASRTGATVDGDKVRMPEAGGAVIGVPRP